MSQHYFTCKAESTYQVVLGYDRPLQRYFLRILREDADPMSFDGSVYDSMLEPHSDMDVLDLCDLLATYRIPLSVDLLRTLWNEADGTSPTNVVVDHGPVETSSLELKLFKAGLKQEQVLHADSMVWSTRNLAGPLQVPVFCSELNLLVCVPNSVAPVTTDVSQNQVSETIEGAVDVTQDEFNALLDHMLQIIEPKPWLAVD